MLTCLTEYWSKNADPFPLSISLLSSNGLSQFVSLLARSLSSVSSLSVFLTQQLCHLCAVFLLQARIADFGLHKRINKVCEARVKSVRRMTYKGSVPISALDDSAIYETESCEATETGDGSRTTARTRSSKKNVTWNDQDEEVPQAATDPHQGWEDPSGINVAQSGVSSSESPTAGASLRPERYPGLRGTALLQTIPEDVPMIDELSSNAWKTSISNGCRNTRMGIQPITLPVPLVVALEPPWEPPELMVMDDIKSQRAWGKNNMGLELNHPSFEESFFSVWESNLSGGLHTHDVACPSTSETQSSPHEGKVHGGDMGGLLPVDGSSLLSADLDAELMLLEPHLPCAECKGAKVTNLGNGLDGLGDGGSGVDHEFQPVDTPFEQGRGAALKFEHETHTDAHLDEKERENAGQLAISPRETTSAALSSINESLGEVIKYNWNRKPNCFVGEYSYILCTLCSL